jgi:hypothetical protein
MIYMHNADARRHEIADTLTQLARQELQPSAAELLGDVVPPKGGLRRSR